MSSRRLISVGIGILFLIVLLLGGYIWWNNRSVSSDVPSLEETFVQPELSEYDLALRAEPYFWTCTEQVEYYWGGVSKKLQEYKETYPERDFAWDLFMNDMYEFYAFVSSFSFMEETRYKERILASFEEITGQKFSIEEFTPLLLEHSLTLFENQVGLYYQLMSDDEVQRLRDTAVLEAFLYADGLVIVDMIQRLPLQASERGVYLERLADVLGMSWMDMDLWIGRFVFRGEGTGITPRYPQSLSESSYDQWFTVMYAPLVRIVYRSYLDLGVDIMESPLLRQVIATSVESQPRRGNDFYYRPIPYHPPENKYFEVLRSCMTGIENIDLYYQGYIQLIEEIVKMQPQPLTREITLWLQPMLELIAQYGYTSVLPEMELYPLADTEQFPTREETGWYVIESWRMEQLFADVRAIPEEERQQSAPWARLRAVYLQDLAEEELSLISEYKDTAKLRRKLLEKFLQEIGKDVSLFSVQ